MWEENWPALQVFLLCQTQWRVGMTGFLGLDYSAVRWVMEMEKTSDPLDCLRRVQIIESEVIASTQQKMEE